MSALFQFPKPVRIKASGSPYAGAKAFFFETGTTTPKEVYTDAARTIPFSQPVQADAGGQFPPVYISALESLKLVLTDSAGVQIDSVDPAFDALFSNSDLSDLIYPPTQTPAELAAGAAVVNAQYPPCHVDRYGTNALPGTTDMATAFQTAVNVARQTGSGANVYWGETGNYLLGSTLVLAAYGVTAVNLICTTPAWNGAPSTVTPTITSTIAGPTINVSGTDVSHLAYAPMIYGGVIQNLSADASASVIKCEFSIGLRPDNCYLRGMNYVVHSPGGECISPRFYETNVDCPSGLAVALYKGGFRNAVWVGGRAYSGQYGWDFSAVDDPTWHGTNCEFCQVVIRHNAMTGAAWFNPHVESFQCLLTNADTVPIDQGGHWVDNGSAGTGINSTVLFKGGVIFSDNANSNLVVIKVQGGFTYHLDFDGVAVTCTNPIVGNSFAPGTGVALPAGTKVSVRNTPGLNVKYPVADAFSGYVSENSGAGAGGIETNALSLRGEAALTSLQHGRSAFSAATSVTVTLPTAEPDNTYDVSLTPLADPVGRLYADTYTTTNFVVHNTSSTSIAFSWFVVR